VHFLHTERAALAELLPGLDDALAALPLQALESPGNPALSLFRAAGGPGLVIPPRWGGLGATPLQAVRIQRALGCRAPSLAVAVTMHHFAVATLVEMAARESLADRETLLRRIAAEHLYLASAFAEGQSGANILSSQLQVEQTPNGLRISGSKKPCSLSASMDILTASVLLPAETGLPPALAVVVVPANTPGIERRAFWNSIALAGAESDEVVLHQVPVTPGQVFRWSGPGSSEAVQQRCTLWFELLITAAYLGIGSALVERVLAQNKGAPVERVLLVQELDAAMAAVEGMALRLMAGDHDANVQVRALFVRFAAQQALERATSLAVELLGGMSFVSSSDVACLLASTCGLAFHPPSRTAIAPSLNGYLGGGLFGTG
jgi:alkylation response protein AidB-like acyl-CoA dehydrogenase